MSNFSSSTPMKFLASSSPGLVLTGVLGIYFNDKLRKLEKKIKTNNNEGLEEDIQDLEGHIHNLVQITSQNVEKIDKLEKELENLREQFDKMSKIELEKKPVPVSRTPKPVQKEREKPISRINLTALDPHLTGFPKPPAISIHSDKGNLQRVVHQPEITSLMTYGHSSDSESDQEFEDQQVQGPEIEYDEERLKEDIEELLLSD